MKVIIIYHYLIANISKIDKLRVIFPMRNQFQINSREQLKQLSFHSGFKLRTSATHISLAWHELVASQFTRGLTTPLNYFNKLESKKCQLQRVDIHNYFYFLKVVKAKLLWYNYKCGRIAQWQSACPRTKKSTVQASATTSCCEGELFIYIQLLLVILASCY